MKTKTNNQNEGRPQAWISVERNRQKIYTEVNSQKVYLRDGQEFQIELFNPTQNRHLVKFKMNGIYQSEVGLILNPGQRYFLDRFIDKEKRLLFSTYDIENTAESLNAIKKNGFLEIEFYKESEKPPMIENWGGTYSTFPTYITYPMYPTYPIYSGTITTDPLTNIYDSSVSLNSVCSPVIFSSLVSTQPKIETGRIEEGEKSDQKFKEGYEEFDSFVSNVVEIQIIPTSQKPLETQEIRTYCTECGARMKKQTWKFCPNCGTKII